MNGVFELWNSVDLPLKNLGVEKNIEFPHCGVTNPRNDGH